MPIVAPTNCSALNNQGLRQRSSMVAALTSIARGISPEHGGFPAWEGHGFPVERDE